MEPEVLNRVGIILNFLAGFLLTPELLGTERLTKLEVYLESTSAKLVQHGRFAINTVLDALYDLTSSKPRHTVFRVVVFMYATAILIMYSLDFAGYMVLIIEKIYPQVTPIYLDFARRIDPTISRIIFMLFLPFPIFLCSLTIIGLVVWIGISAAGLLINKLTGESKLRSMLVSLGIVSFIIGNMLQLIATF